MVVTAGMDLGTTFSSIGVVGSRTSAWFYEQNSSLYIPSILALEGVSMAVGYEALQLYNLKSSTVGLYRDMKRWIGVLPDNFSSYLKSINPDYSVDFLNGELHLGSYKGRGEMLPLSLLLSLMIKVIVSRFSKLTSLNITSLVISVPANFSVVQRKYIKSLEIGLPYTVETILNEPSAAALSGMADYDSEVLERLLVYDFGGGTFDVSAITAYKGTLCVKGAGGDPFLGGRDIDKSLLLFIKQKLNLNLADDLDLDISHIKESLSRSSTTLTFACSLTKNNKTLRVDLSKQDLERIALPYCLRTLKVLEDVYQATSWTGKVNVVMVGGSSYLPGLTDLISRQVYVNKVLLSEEARLAVALGCVMYTRYTVSEGRSLLVDSLNNVILNCRGAETPQVFFPMGSPLPSSSYVRRTLDTSLYNLLPLILYEGKGNRWFKNERVFKSALRMEKLGVTLGGNVTFDFISHLDSRGILTVVAKACDEGSIEFELKNELDQVVNTTLGSLLSKYSVHDNSLTVALRAAKDFNIVTTGWRDVLPTECLGNDKLSESEYLELVENLPGDPSNGEGARRRYDAGDHSVGAEVPTELFERVDVPPILRRVGYREVFQSGS